MPRTTLVIVDPKARIAVVERHNMVQACKSIRVLCKQTHLEKQITASEVISLRRNVSGSLHERGRYSVIIARMSYIPKIIVRSWAE